MTTPRTIAELELMDPAIAAFLEPLLGPSTPPMVAGHETADGHLIEAAFPSLRIGVLLDGDTPPDGWDARPLTDWTAESLLTELSKES